MEISRLKSFRSTVDPSICYVHTPLPLKANDQIVINGSEERIRKVVTRNRSKHWQGHLFYELRLA